MNTLKWLDLAPIFDTGQSLGILSYTDEIIVDGQGKFFYNVDSFETIIQNINDLQRLDLSKLDDVVKEFDDILHKYQDITKLSDNHIHKICVLLNSRIVKLKNIVAI